MDATAQAKRVQILATVIRADGTIENLGTVSDSAWHRRGLGQWLARRRIARANRRLDG